MIRAPCKICLPPEQIRRDSRRARAPTIAAPTHMTLQREGLADLRPRPRRFAETRGATLKPISRLPHRHAFVAFFFGIEICTFVRGLIISRAARTRENFIIRGDAEAG